MRFAARFGTPNELDVKTHKTPTQSKNFLVGKIQDRIEWADRYNAEASRRLAGVREELSSLNVGSLPTGEKRRWTVEDEVTGVEFTYEIERIE